MPEALRATEQAIALAPRKAAYFFNLADLKRFVAGEPELSAMEELAKDASLPVQDRIELHFARAKAYEDLGQRGEFIPPIAGRKCAQARADRI